jgi:hypothetical protein
MIAVDFYDPAFIDAGVLRVCNLLVLAGEAKLSAEASALTIGLADFAAAFELTEPSRRSASRLRFSASRVKYSLSSFSEANGFIVFPGFGRVGQLRRHGNTLAAAHLRRERDRGSCAQQDDKYG